MLVAEASTHFLHHHVPPPTQNLRVAVQDTAPDTTEPHHLPSPSSSPHHLPSPSSPNPNSLSYPF